MKVIKPNEVCTHSYLVIGNFSCEEDATNLLSYLKTRFVRFLILLALSSIHISRSTFSFVPMQDFTPQSDIDWNKSVTEIDKQLFDKYGFTPEEIELIEGMIKPM